MWAETQRLRDHPLYSYVCVLILPDVSACPHTTTVSVGRDTHRIMVLPFKHQRKLIFVSSYYHIRVLILLYTCPHTTIYVSSYYYYTCVSETHSMMLRAYEHQRKREEGSAWQGSMLGLRCPR
jgi:hypothetical protein